MVRIRDKLAEYGLAPTPFNIAIGLTVFQGLSCVSTFGGWALCYKLLGRPIGTRLLARFDQYPKYTRTITWCQSKIEKSRYIVPLVKYCVPSVKHWNGEKLLLSFAMMNTVCITLSPVLVALELAATVYILQALNQQHAPTLMTAEPGMSKIDNVMRALNQKPAPTILTYFVRTRITRSVIRALLYDSGF